MSDKVLSFADRRRARHLDRVLEVQKHAPELAECEVTDGIRWTLLSRPYPEACSLLVAHILEMEALRRARQRPPQPAPATTGTAPSLPPSGKTEGPPIAPEAV